MIYNDDTLFGLIRFYLFFWPMDYFLPRTVGLDHCQEIVGCWIDVMAQIPNTVQLSAASCGAPSVGDGVLVCTLAVDKWS